MLSTKRNVSIEDYQLLIQSMDVLTLKMEIIAQEFFEANIDFISQVTEADLKKELCAEGLLSFYGDKFNNILNDIENGTKLLKQQKINYQFRKNLIEDDDPLF